MINKIINNIKERYCFSKKLELLDSKIKLKITRSSFCHTFLFGFPLFMSGYLLINFIVPQFFNGIATGGWTLSLLIIQYLLFLSALFISKNIYINYKIKKKSNFFKKVFKITKFNLLKNSYKETENEIDSFLEKLKPNELTFLENTEAHTLNLIKIRTENYKDFICNNENIDIINKHFHLFQNILEEKKKYIAEKAKYSGKDDYGNFKGRLSNINDLIIYLHSLNTHKENNFVLSKNKNISIKNI